MKTITIISFILTIASLLFAFIIWYKTENAKRRLRIEISRLVTESHGIRFEIMNLLANLSQSDLDKAQGRLDSFNHSIFVGLLSLDEKVAYEWLKINKRNQNGTVDWNYYRSLLFFKFRNAEKR